VVLWTARRVAAAGRGGHYADFGAPQEGATHKVWAFGPELRGTTRPQLGV